MLNTILLKPFGHSRPCQYYPECVFSERDKWINIYFIITVLQLLEVQQQLAVAVSAERKKDAMIEQLDKVCWCFPFGTLLCCCSLLWHASTKDTCKGWTSRFSWTSWFNILLLQTLAKVVDGWKKHESEKVTIINQLKVERETAEQSQQRQQEVPVMTCNDVDVVCKNK